MQSVIIGLPDYLSLVFEIVCSCSERACIVKLYADFKSTSFRPKLKNYEPEVLTGYIKYFLKQLRVCTFFFNKTLINWKIL